MQKGFMFRIRHKFLSFILVVFLLKKKIGKFPKSLTLGFQWNWPLELTVGFKKIKRRLLCHRFRDWSFLFICLLNGEWWHFRKLRTDCVQNMKKETWEQNSSQRCAPKFFLLVLTWLNYHLLNFTNPDFFWKNTVYLYTLDAKL